MGEPTNETEQLLADLTHDATLLRGRLILDHDSGDFGRALEDRVALANRVHSDVALLAPILAAMRSRLTVLEQENAELLAVEQVAREMARTSGWVGHVMAVAAESMHELHAVLGKVHPRTGTSANDTPRRSPSETTAP